MAISILEGFEPMHSQTDTTPPVVVLGSGVTALGLCRTLSKAGIANYLVNADGDFANRSRWVQPLEISVTESADPDLLVGLLERLEFDRAVLMPCSDRWSNAVAGLPAEWSERFPASFSTGRAVEVLTDKDLLRQCLERLDLPGPRTIPVSDAGDMAEIPDEEIPGFFLKPRDSQSFSRHFRRKAFTVTDRSNAADRLSEMTAAGFEAVFQEYVAGPMDAHYFVDGFADRNNAIKALFARRRLLMFPVDFGNSTLMESVPLDEVSQAVDVLERLLADLNYRGIFNAEFKRDERDGVFKLLEVNVRPWWFVEFAALCGVDVGTMAYRDALGLPVEPVFRYSAGTKHMMFSQHLRAFLALRSSDGLKLSQWLRDSRGASDAVFRWSDPLPGIALTVEYLKKAWLRSVPGRRSGRILP